MDLVYGNAHLTICAADGEGATTPLKGITPKERTVTQYEEECGQGLRLMVSHLAESYIQRSTWNTRGWTFQERLLSKRCVIFARNRVFFQCRAASMSEDIVAEQKDAGWSIELVQAPLQMLNEINTRPFYMYMDCVRLYTARMLSHPTDILAAFQGIANLLGKAMAAPLSFGLPCAYFDLALLWEARTTVQRRYAPKHLKGRTADPSFPSWSWCGWTGSPMEYRVATIGGCISNVHEWLNKHTWIVWYIRDGQGNLRLVWNGSSHEPLDLKLLPRWHGYLPKQKGTDEYGRIPKFAEEASHFEKTLPEYPYQVGFAPGSYENGHDDQPDQTYLQFWTWSTHLRIVAHDPLRQATDDRLRRYDIADYSGDWCGTIILNQEWAENHQSEVEHEFIAISEARDFSDEENESWTYYIPKEKEHSEWDLYYVLLLEHRGAVSYRVGLGKIFEDALENSCLPGTSWKEIILG